MFCKLNTASSNVFFLIEKDIDALIWDGETEKACPHRTPHGSRTLHVQPNLHFPPLFSTWRRLITQSLNKYSRFIMN